MKITCESGVEFYLDSCETIAQPHDKQAGDTFDFDTDLYSLDRAWVFIHIGGLIVHKNRVEKIKDMQ